MKKLLIVLICCVIILCSFTGCSARNSAIFNTSKYINVISREDGSGTRGAFIELFGIEVKPGDGTRKDKTTKEAIIAKQTDVMMTNVVSDKYAIGYISLGSLNDTVRAVQIDGTEASAENVKNGTYIVARPFNIATKGNPPELVQDFVTFILSVQGQAVVGKSYITINDAATEYSGGRLSGKIVVGGSTSVAPLMEKLKEAYLQINLNASIEIQQIDSTAGMTGVIDGIYDIGVSSRALKESEVAQLTPTMIALDGIAVIVNNNNPVVNLSKEQVKSIFTGETKKWGEIIK